MSHLRVFGCDAYSHVPRDERGKLDSKTKKCWMLGYGSTTKGYRLYDRNRKKVFYSRDVAFDEQGTGFQKETQLSPEKNPVRSEAEKISNQPVVMDCSGDLTDENLEGEENQDPASAPRRSGRPTREPDWFGDRVVCLFADVLDEPTNLKDALSAAEAGEWRRAMENELESLKSNEVWTLTDL